LLFYFDQNSNIRLESIHCNDFPSNIISEQEILDWNFSEDTTGYLSRMNVISVPSAHGSQYSQSGADQHMWASTIDFEMLERYGYRCESRNHTSVKADVTRGKGAWRSSITAAAVMSRRYMDMTNGKIMAGTVTMHANHAIKPNSTVYIPMRNMIYTVIAISYSQDSDGGQDVANLQLAYGRKPGHFYEGLLYGYDADFFKENEILRLRIVKEIRDRERLLWSDDELYKEQYWKEMHYFSERYSDWNMKNEQFGTPVNFFISPDLNLAKQDIKEIIKETEERAKALYGSKG